MWKVIRLSDGNTLKAGFDSEELARDWMETQDEESLDCSEMEGDEEEEYLEALEDEDVEELASEDFEKAVEGNIDYNEYDDDYDADSGILNNEFEPDDDDL